MEELNIEQFNPTKADLQLIVGATQQVTITDWDDKTQVKAVKESRIRLRDARVAISKKGKELRQNAINFSKEVISYEKNLIEVIEPEEKRLKELEEEAGQRKIRAERIALLPERKRILHDIDGRDYSDADEVLLSMDADEFLAHCNTKRQLVNEVKEKELKDKEDELKIKEKEEQDKKDEREKLEQEDRDKKDKAKRERVEKRVNEVVALGLMHDHEKGAYVLGDLFISVMEIETDTDTEFATKVERLRVEIAQRRKNIEDKEKEAVKQLEKAEAEKKHKFVEYLKSLGWTEETKLNYLLQHDKVGDKTEVKVYKLLGVYNEK